MSDSQDAPATPVAMKLELIVIPVADAERSKAFYTSLGRHCDIDHTAASGMRIVQFTPPGSDASIMFGVNISSAPPGSASGLHLSTANVEAARSDFQRRGVSISELFHDDGGIFHRTGADGHVSGPNAERKSYASYASFCDPDGNTWIIQEIGARLDADLTPGDTRFTPQLVKAALGIP
jgi:catechol 2,3-dioxygenase-like lactoylglutathione lyase family enzyme